MSNLVPIPSNAVIRKDGHPITTSLRIAEVFGKLHKNVLRDIRDIDCSEKFGRLNFEQSSYLNDQGKWQPMVEMTRDGFVFLVMGFAGPEAARFKEAYIDAFNAMEERIRGDADRVRLDLIARNRRLEEELLRQSPDWALLRRCNEAGLTNHQTARALGWGETTVRDHKRRLRDCGLIVGRQMTLFGEDVA